MTIPLPAFGQVLAGLFFALAAVIFYKLCKGAIRVDGVLTSEAIWTWLSGKPGTRMSGGEQS